MKLFTAEGFSAGLLHPPVTCDERSRPRRTRFGARLPNLFLIQASRPPGAGAEAVLASLAETVTDCKDEIKPGLYHASNAFVYLTEGVAGGVGVGGAVFSDRRVRRHGRVAVVAAVAFAASAVDDDAVQPPEVSFPTR